MKSLYQMAREMNRDLQAARQAENKEKAQIAIRDATWCEYCPPIGDCIICRHTHNHN